MKLTEKDKNLVLRALLENCAVLADAVGESEELDETFELLEYVKADGVEANMDDILDFVRKWRVYTAHLQKIVNAQSRSCALRFMIWKRALNPMRTVKHRDYSIG